MSSNYDIKEQERINLKAAKERLDHFYMGKPPPASDYWASLLYRGSPVEQYGYEDPIIKQSKYPPIWETPYAWDPPDAKLRFIPIEQPANQLTRQPFNPYDVGVASYLRNVWGVAWEKAKQENTTPKIYTYEQPSPTGSGGNSGMGGVIGWFQGIPQYFINLREQDKKDWVDYKAGLEERRNVNRNPEGQDVISDADKEDPRVIFAGASGKPSDEASIIEKSGDTWEDFVSGVKAGWEAGGLTDYKTPLLIAAGVVLLIIIIK